MNTRVVRPDVPALVPALYSGREQAEAAIAKLRDFGIADTDIGVALPAAGRYQRREPSDRETVAAAGVGAAIGGRFGSLAGLGLFGLVGGEAVALTVGGFLVAGAGGLVWGAAIGGLLGVMTRVRRRSDEDSWTEVELDSDDVLVVVRVHDWSHEPEIAKLLQQNGARAVLDELTLDKHWRDLELVHPSGQPAPPGFQS